MGETIWKKTNMPICHNGSTNLELGTYPGLQIPSIAFTKNEQTLKNNRFPSPIYLAQISVQGTLTFAEGKNLSRTIITLQ